MISMSMSVSKMLRMEIFNTKTKRCKNLLLCSIRIKRINLNDRGISSDTAKRTAKKHVWQTFQISTIIKLLPKIFFPPTNHHKLERSHFVAVSAPSVEAFEAASMISWTRFKHYGIGPTGTKSMTGQLVFCL